MVRERIQAWMKNHGDQPPANIIYFRDGVGDSQYAQVKAEELPEITAAFNVAAPNHTVRLTALVVVKRHHTRFYSIAQEDTHGKEKEANCKPGTLVDQIVTSPYFTDFFLQSHTGLKGTAKPAHYFVLQDDIKFNVNALHQFVSTLPCRLSIQSSILANSHHRSTTYASPTPAPP
jgi:eukaryotic translation initiation factor 2C